MSPEVAVAVGAMAGAPARFLLDRAIRSPWGIVAVNLLGCLAVGVLVGAMPSDLVARLVGVGFLGAFTTASTVAWDVLSRRSPLLLALHVVPGLLLAGVGLAVGRAL